MAYQKPVRRNLLTAAVLVAVIVGVPASIFVVRSHHVAANPTLTQESPTYGQSQAH